MAPELRGAKAIVKKNAVFCEYPRNLRNMRRKRGEPEG